MKDFKVKVYRVYEDSSSQTLDGWFFSKVYAVNECQFLVYDDGFGSANDEYYGGFEWVNFTELFSNPFPDGHKRPVVELWEDEEE